jgi:predicted CXXCH cytochrome family protein
MKRVLKTGLVIALLVVVVAPVWGKGTANVANTIHNLSATGVDPFFGTPGSSFYATDEDQICVFCHTPHGGILNGPLWNHSVPSSTSFTHYNSATVSTYLAGLSVSRPVSDESLICMACHDGSISVNHVINAPNDRSTPIQTSFDGNADTKIIDLFGGSVGARIGASLSNTSGSGDLSDDHPISFSYDSVLADPMYAAGGPKFNQLRPVGNTGNTSSALGWNGEGVRFFGSTNRVECSSCHDPHVDYTTAPAYAPFLIRPNNGSNLCLACHNK